MIGGKLLLFAFILQLIQTDLTFLNQTYNPNITSGFVYQSIKSQSGILSTLSLGPSTAIISYKNLTQNLTLTNSLGTTTNLQKIRLPSWDLSSEPNNSVLVLNANQLINYQQFQNFNGQALDFSNFPNNFNIIDACYGNSSTQIYVFGQFSSNTFYTMILFNGSAIPTSTKNLNISSSTCSMAKMMCQHNRIYISFTDKIITYQMSSNITEIACFAYSSIAEIDNIDFYVNLEILVFCYSNQIVIVNTTSNQIMRNYSHTSLVSRVILVESYIILVDEIQIVQYDYEIGQITSKIYQILFTKYNIEYLTQRTFFLYKQPSMNPSDSIIFYNYSNSYSSNTSNCLPTYIFSPNQLLCIKNIINSSLIPNSTNISNTTNLISNNSNSAASNSILLNQTSQLIDDAQDFSMQTMISQYFIYLSKNYGIILCDGASAILIASSFKISPQFLFSFIIIFDDLWLYRFHNKTYPHSMRIIFQNVDIIEHQRLNVWFLNVIRFLNATSNFGIRNNQQMQEQLLIQSLKQENVFFGRSLVQDYRNSFLVPLFLYLIIKIIKLILNPLKKKAKCVLKLYNFFHRHSKLWMCFSEIVETILPKITFDFGVQILRPSFFNCLDKINLSICTLGFFVIINYSMSFYPIIFCSYNKKSAKQLMKPCRYRRGSFFFQPALMLLRVVIRSFINSYFLKNYLLQIFLLFVIDSLSIILSIYMRKYYKKVIIFVFYTLYMIFLTIFDLFFYLESSNLIPKYTRRQLFGVIIVAALFLCSMIVCLVFFVKYLMSLLKSWSKFIKNNKITSTKNRPTKKNMKLSITTKCVPIQNKVQVITQSEQKKKKTKKDGMKINSLPVCMSPAQQIKKMNRSLHMTRNKLQEIMKKIIQVKIADNINQQVQLQQPELVLAKTNSI